MQELPQMNIPGAWPEEVEYEYNFTRLPPSPPPSSPRRFIKAEKRTLYIPSRILKIGALLQFFNPWRIFKKPVAPSQRQQRIAHEAQQIQEIQEVQATQEIDQITTPEKEPEAQQATRKRRDSFGDFFSVPETLEYTPQKPTWNLPASYVGESARQHHHRKHQLPQGWGQGKFDPATIIPTPVRTRALRTPHSARRWSPYHYEHGINRPAKSILRSSRLRHQPFEPTVHIESPDKYIEEEISPIDPDGDVEMLPADVPIRKRKIQIARTSYSSITLERIDGVNGVAKYYEKHLGINEKYGPAYENYRDPVPEFDPDESFRESPKPAGFDAEQFRTPTKDYKQVVDQEMFDGIKNWYKNLEERDGDPTANMSPAMRKRYAPVAEQRALERATARHKIEEAKRAELKKERDEQDRLARELQAKKQAEADLLKEVALHEAAMLAEKQAEEERENEQAKADARSQARLWPPQGWDCYLPVYAKVDKGLEAIDPTQVLIERPQLTRHDLGTLLPANYKDAASGWLNDAIVVTALEHLVKAANLACGHNMQQRDTPAPYWVFNSNWYTQVKDGSGISKWAGKRGANLNGKKLLDARMILFPVCEGLHWTVTILHPRERAIECLNSLDTNPDSPYNKRIRQKVLSWVKHELGSDYMELEWQDMPSYTTRQDNACDCGVFTVMNSIARVSGIETWAMRAQVNARRIGILRAFLAGMLFNGGFDTVGPFRLAIEDRHWEGGFMENPQYWGKLVHGY